MVRSDGRKRPPRRRSVVDGTSRRSAAAHIDVAAHAARLRADGYTIIEDFLDAAAVSALREALAPFLGAHLGRNPFEGLTTERVYTLVGRGEMFEDLAADARLMALLGEFLQPGFLLSASHAICIHPGEAPQALHFDDSFYPIPRPRPAIGMSVIGAVDAFTEANGATRLIPGSHLWGEDWRERRHGAATVPLVMAAGAIAIFHGALVHGAGANRSAAPRLAYTNQYCEPWARTQENFFLGVPREQVRTMSPVLKSLLGYSIMPPFMGQVTASHPLKTLEPDWTPAIQRHVRPSH
jgi:ectoine hydroxylase-related dioxygenase (phytanoyl-CoA dioxygenase family)